MYLGIGRKSWHFSSIVNGILGVCSFIWWRFQASFEELRVWHLDFRLGARKGLLVKISSQKQDFWLFYILSRAPSLNLGTHSKILGHKALGPWESRTLRRIVCHAFFAIQDLKRWWGREPEEDWNILPNRKSCGCRNPTELVGLLPLGSGVKVTFQTYL